MSLKIEALNSVRWTTFSSAVNAMLQLIQLMILARYLSIHDFGLLAILMIVINFSQLFVDFGFSQAIIHKKNITNTQLSTLYWLNILLSFFIFIILFLVAPFIANFYKEQELYLYIIIISSSLVIQAFGQQFKALFQKELQFNTLAKIDIFAAIISFITAVLLAINGFGIYALIFPVLVMAGIKSILLIHKGLNYHKPTFVFKLAEVKELLLFGSYTVGNGIVSTIATQIDVILIGKLLGTETLGLYNIAKELILRPIQLINPIITKIAFPVMSKVNHDINHVKRIYLKLIKYIASVNFPIYVVSFILAPEIITLFLGEKWLNATSVFQILSIWALLRSVGNPVGSLVMAMGKPQYEMYWNISIMFFTFTVVYVSSFWGIEGVAWGNAGSMLVLFIPGWYFLVHKLCKASLMEYIESVIVPLWISIGTGVIINTLLSLNEGSMIYKLIFTSVVGLSILWILYKFFNKDFYNILKNSIRRNNDF